MFHIIIFYTGDRDSVWYISTYEYVGIQCLISWRDTLYLQGGACPGYQSINQSNFYSANIPGEARLSGVTAKSVFNNSKIEETVP